ncbi:MAG: MerR family transcriptional regulator [Caldicoprobacterales bacterium]|jgi:DNA-binding transcriptional MerR regulator|nr:MerR family transcriptional regulator [Clostridiales bacterium]
MEYTVNKLAKLAGVSSRTLRYYDEIGLLTPKRISSNGYRIYGQKEVDRLQQILFYRELGVNLDEIKRILSEKNFDGLSALQDHLRGLLERKQQLELLIENVEKTIKAMKGEIIMTDKEKFQGFLKNMVDDNERQFGKEIREKYGKDAVNRSNAKVLGMTQEQYAALDKLTKELNETLKKAVEQGDPGSPSAQKACELHKEWLCYFWDNYSKEAHIGLTQMYVNDPRFTEYYEKIAPGCAVFLRDAVAIFCK